MSEGEEEIFLSPEYSLPDPPAAKKSQSKDQGASPVLRRSTRKRRSTTGAEEMTKGSGKKKKTSPPKKTIQEDCAGSDQGKNMQRTPKASAAQPNPNQPTGRPTELQPTADLQTWLAGMESRLASKLDKANDGVKEALDLNRQTNLAVKALEETVADNDSKIKEALSQAENRILTQIDERVGTLVHGHLKSIGFDTQLTAGCLTGAEVTTSTAGSYAAAVRNTADGPIGGKDWGSLSHGERREERYWEARLSLIHI